MSDPWMRASTELRFTSARRIDSCDSRCDLAGHTFKLAGTVGTPIEALALSRIDIESSVEESVLEHLVRPRVEQVRVGGRPFSISP